MSTPSVLNFGLLSTAGINKNIIPAIRAASASGAFLHSVASRSKESAASYAAKWEIPHSFGTYDELLDCGDVHVVYVPLPNAMHKEWCIKAMRKGKHVLCEKPLALVESDVVEMYAVAKECGVVLMEAFMWTHLEQSRALFDLVNVQKAIGDVESIHSAFTFVLAKDGHRSGPLSEGGGSLWDVGVYPLSFARFIFNAEPVEVFCKVMQSTVSDADDSAHAIVTFAGGRILHLYSSFRAPLRMTAELVGTEGSITVPNAFKAERGAAFQLRSKASEDKPVDVVPNEPCTHVYQGEIEHIIKLIRGGAEAISRGVAQQESFSVGSVRGINALHLSAKTGLPAKL